MTGKRGGSHTLPQTALPDIVAVGLRTDLNGIGIADVIAWQVTA